MHACTHAGKRARRALGWRRTLRHQCSRQCLETVLCPSASGTIGMGEVAHAKPDGYKIGVMIAFVSASSLKTLAVMADQRVKAFDKMPTHKERSIGLST